MKLLTVLLFGLCLTLHANVYSQHAKVNLEMKGVSLVEVLNEMSKQTQLDFLFNFDLIKSKGNVDIDVKDREWQQVLEELLPSRNLEYVYDEHVVVVKTANTPQQRLALVKGRIIDENKEPLPGVTVLIKGTTLGVVTNSQGEYQLNVPEDAVLVFTFVGLVTQEIHYTGQKEINVTMQEEHADIDEVVVTGYFTTSKSSYTGAARTITAEELRQGGNQNLFSMLSNIDPSFVQVEDISAGSNPNVIPDFQIRGSSSIGGLRDDYTGNPNMPVFIVDGFEVTAEKVFDMDPHRVSTITLLKDASATAIYGSRAANGVVVITTASPGRDEISVSYSGDATFYVADLTAYNLCNARQKLEVEKLAGLYEVPYRAFLTTQNLISNQIEMDKAYNWRLANTLMGYDTYWLDKPLNSLTVAHKHAITVDGNAGNLLYALNLNYNNTPGVMKESSRRRLGISLKLQYIYKSLTFKNELSYTNVKSKNSSYGSFSEYTKLNPYVPYKDENGEYIYKIEEDDRMDFSSVGIENMKMYNPLYNTKFNTIDESKYDDVTNLFGIDWWINDDLRLKGTFSFTVQNNSSDKFKPAGHTDFADYTGDDFIRRGSYNASQGESFSYDGSIILTYFKHFNKHVLSANAGWNIMESKQKSFSVKAEGFPNDNLDYISFATQYALNGSPSGDEYTSRLFGFLGNVNYSFDDRFLVDLSIRGDASSQFGSDKRWAPFWSVGIGYNLHNEKSIRNIGWVDMLKLRATYGLTGSQNFNPYQAMTTYKYLNSERYQNLIGAEVMTMGNPELSWQRTYQWNFGADIGLWNNRLSLAFDYYIKTSKDVLTAVTLPPSLGFTSYMANLGEVENRGWETNLRVTLLRNKDFYWSVNGSAIHNRNKLLKISNALRAYNDTQDELSSSGNKNNGANRTRVRYIEGKSMNSIWVNKSLGVDPITGREMFRAANGEVTHNWSAANYVIGGCMDPDLEGTFGTNFTWKGLQLSLIFRYRIGGQAYNQTLIDKVQDVDPKYNIDLRAYEERWQKPGDKVRFTAYEKDVLNRVNRLKVTKPTSRFVEDYNYLNLATLNIAYDFGVKKLENIGVKRLKAYLYLNDVFYSSSIKRERGIDYPFARNFSLGMQVSF